MVLNNGLFCRLTIVGLFALALSCVSSGQTQDYSRRHLKAAKTSTPPVIDGDLSDPCWKNAPVADQFTDFMNGNLVADQTTVRMLYDEKAMYFAFECRDARPGGIVARETVRDTKFQGNNNGPNNKEDNVEIDFDPFNTKADRDLSMFSVNAIGTRSAYLSGGRGSKAEWKGDWEAAVKRTTEGWTCEIRIPWTCLSYPNSAGPTTFGINFYRFQDRTKILSAWSNEGAQGFTALEGCCEGLSVPQARFKPVLSLLPYVLGTGTTSSFDTKVGLDARYRLTPQLTAVGSVNPDFSTVEGAVQSITFSHVEKSLPDNRPFFSEGGDSFGFNINGNDIGAYLYTNRIPTFDAGAKFYGKINPKDTVGFLDTYSFDGRNDLATHFSHSYTDTSSGGLTVVQNSVGGVTNTVTAMDQHFRFGKLGLEGEIANSNGPGAGGGAELLSAYYADKRVFTVLQYSGISNNFLTPDGYFPYTGYRGPYIAVDYGAQWRQGFWRSFDLNFGALDWTAMGHGQYFMARQAALTYDTRSDWEFQVGFQRNRFEGSNDNFYTASITKGVTNRFLQVGLQGQFGEQGDARSNFVGPSASFRVLKKLDISYAGSLLNRLGVSQQHIINFNYELSPIRSFGGRVVIQDADTNVFFFYHRSGGKGTDIFFLIGDPNAARFARQFQIKLVFAV